MRDVRRQLPVFKYPYKDVSEADRRHPTIFGNYAEHYIFTFPNGYGASVIYNKVSIGREQHKYELAVLKNDEIYYGSPLTEDVIGGCSINEINDILDNIASWN